MAPYLLSVWHDDDYDDDPDAPGNEEQMAQTAELTADIERAGVWVFTAGLPPASAASVVRTSGGAVVTTDGPYAETKEQVGGFWIVDVPDRQAALDWAARATLACGRPVEVRPVHG